MKSQRRRDLVIIVSSRDHFVKKIHKKKQDWKNKLARYFTNNYNKQRFASILLIVESRASQLFTLQKETFSTFGDFALNHKLYLGDNSTSLMCEWKALLLSNY
jgi:hypothetical protein